MTESDSLAAEPGPLEKNSFMPSTRNEGSSIASYVILAALLLIAVWSWASLVWDYPASAMDMRLPSTMGLSLAPFLAIWVIMMVAMMFPNAAPMILTFHNIQRRRTERGAFLATWVFVAGYLALWAMDSGRCGQSRRLEIAHSGDSRRRVNYESEFLIPRLRSAPEQRDGAKPASA